MITSVEKLDGVLKGLAGLRLLLLEQLVRRDGLVTLAFGQSFFSKFLLKEIKWWYLDEFSIKRFCVKFIILGVNWTGER